jgi:SAM-dependent methyltransferase
VAGGAHGWEQWTWDPTLFEGTAEHYVRGRLPWAPGFAEALAEDLDLDGTGRALDVGCGPGIVALALAPHVEHVVGVDADAGMIAEAARRSTAASVTNATWVHRRAEELPAGLGTFRIVTFAASFHWMDRPRVATTVRSMLDAGGAVVQVTAPAYRPADVLDPGAGSPTGHPPPPDDAIDDLRRRYLGDERRAGQSIRTSSPDGEDGVFQAAGFAPMREVVVPDGRRLTRSIDELVALVLSMSSTAPHLFGERLPAFEADLRAVLHDASPAGRFDVVLPDTTLRIWSIATPA